MNLLQLFNGGLKKGVRKAACSSGSVESSNPCRRRGWWFHHHDGGVYYMFVLCVVSRLVVVNCRMYFCLTIRLIVLFCDSPMGARAPYLDVDTSVSEI